MLRCRLWMSNKRASCAAYGRARAAYRHRTGAAMTVLVEPFASVYDDRSRLGIILARGRGAFEAYAAHDDHAELGQMPAQNVHQTRTLPHQPLPATVQQHSSLRVSRLDRHKAHRRAPNRLADRFRIGGIVLVALDVRLHVLRRHQSHLVAKRARRRPGDAVELRVDALVRGDVLADHA